MDFDLELFERFLDSEADQHTAVDGLIGVDACITDVINNDANVGVQFTELSDGNFFDINSLFFIC